MEHGLSVFKGANVSEDILKQSYNVTAILSNSYVVMGVRADGDYLSAQLLKAANEVNGGDICR